MHGRLFSNGQCPYYRRRQTAGGDGSDHDCCGAEQSPYARILVHRLAAGTSPWRAFTSGGNPAPPYPRQMT